MNFAYLALLWTVRRQIGMKVGDLKSAVWKSVVSDAPTGSMMSDNSTKLPTDSTKDKRVRKQSVSRSVVRNLANSDDLSQSMHQARDLQGLHRAEMDLAVIALSVIILGVGGFGVTMDIAILNGQRAYFTQRWVM